MSNFIPTEESLERETTTIADVPDVFVDYPHKITDQGYSILAGSLTFVWVTGTIFNITCLIVFLGNKKLRTPTNMFIMALNLSDLGMCLIGTFMSMTSSWSKHWLYGPTGCTFEGFMVYFLGLTSMYLLCAISVDRYVVIAKPLLGSKINHKIAFVCILLCWFGGFMWAAFPLMGWNEYVLEGAGVSCSVIWESSNPNYTSYIFTIFFFCLVLPLVIIIFSYFGVYMTIRSLSQNKNFDKNSRIAKKNMKVEKKMAKTIAVMLGGFLGCWMPYAIVSFIIVFQGSEVISPEMASYPAVLAKSQGFWNPLLYVASNKQFRQAFYSIIPCSGIREAMEKREEDKPDSDDSGDEEEAKKKETKKNKVAPAVHEEEKTQIEYLDVPGKATEVVEMTQPGSSS